MRKSDNLTPSSVARHFSGRLRRRMDELDMTQSDLARLTYIEGEEELQAARQRVHRWYWGMTLPSMMSFLNLCQALDCRPDDLINMSRKR